MKWRTHREITRAVSSRFSDQAERIAEASTLPDREPDYVYRAGYGEADKVVTAVEKLQEPMGLFRYSK